MSFLPSTVEDRYLDVFMAIADGFIHEVDVATIKDSLDKHFPENKIPEYVKTVTRPSDIPEFRPFVKSVIENNTTTSIRLFGILMSVLDSRILSPVLTNTTTLIREMDEKEKEALLRSWRDSPIEPKQRIFRLLFNIVASTFQRLAPPIHQEAMGFPTTDERENLVEGHEVDPFRYQMKEPPKTANTELFLPNVDAVIIGSGSGAGVVAHTLANDGHKVLVLEKGRYFHSSEFEFDEVSGYQELYEGRGQLPTNNSQLMVLAGATFGGGSTVNWSACIKTPFKVRKEWYDDFGVDWVATESYDNDLEYVLQQMGASTENITHSFSNQQLLQGCEKLGYPAKEVLQNNGVHTNHSCGKCHLGCKWGVKQGSVANWFRDAAENGAEFMDQVMVSELIRNRKGITTGLKCVDLRTGNAFSIRGAKKYIVACGSLQTPVLLQKSGFKNKHIGRNLKLHPISSLLGYFENVRSDPHYNSIMTSVCTKVDDLDGKSHGCKIETLLHAPMLESVFLPWDSSDQFRQDILKYQGLTAFILLDRDTLSGYVTYDKNKPDKLLIDYTVNKYDRNAILQALLTSADIIYVQGAKEIVHPSAHVPRFISNRPAEQRNINDADYQKWRKNAESIGLTPYGCTYGSAHQMSTCRMSGKGSKYGACDAKGRLFESDNVYVADASVLPTASGANPMVSTMACARHIANGISKELRPSAKF